MWSRWGAIPLLSEAASPAKARMAWKLNSRLPERNSCRGRQRVWRLNPRKRFQHGDYGVSLLVAWSLRAWLRFPRVKSCPSRRAKKVTGFDWDQFLAVAEIHHLTREQFYGGRPGSRAQVLVQGRKGHSLDLSEIEVSGVIG